MAIPERYQFCSEYKVGGEIHVFVGKDGEPRASYPHVHVIHKTDGQVDIVASVGEGDHPWRTTLHGDPPGYEVEAAIDEARDYLPY